MKKLFQKQLLKCFMKHFSENCIAEAVADSLKSSRGAEDDQKQNREAEESKKAVEGFRIQCRVWRDSFFQLGVENLDDHDFNCEFAKEVEAEVKRISNQQQEEKEEEKAT